MINKQENKVGLDGLQRKKKQELFLDLPMARFIRKYKNSSILFTKNGRQSSFFTQDSKLYITPDEYQKIKKGEKIFYFTNQLDSVLSRKFQKTNRRSMAQKDVFYRMIRSQYIGWKNYLCDLFDGAMQGVTLVRMWNLSIVGAVIFGMLTMTMIYRYLGQNVSAAIQENALLNQVQSASITSESMFLRGNVIGSDSSRETIDAIDTDFVTRLLENYKENNIDFEHEIMEMVKGYPIEDMVPEIAKKDRIVAAFIIAIAKKESAWGKHVPILDGQDCYNYWGYRGIRDRMGTGGHTCFDSAKDAVDTVAGRIEILVEKYDRNTPAEMVVWKCGSDCSVTGGQAAANKWISDVAMYFNKLNKADN